MFRAFLTITIRPLLPGQISFRYDIATTPHENLLQDANDFCVDVQKKITEINGLEDKFRSFFILDKKNYSLQECFKVMGVFCTKFEYAIEVSWGVFTFQERARVSLDAGVILPLL